MAFQVRPLQQLALLNLNVTLWVTFRRGWRSGIHSNRNEPAILLVPPALYAS